MLSKITTIIIGVGCLWYGFHIIKEGWSHLYGYPISRATGVIVAIFGIVLILFATFRKNVPKKDEEKFVICLGCKETFYAKDVSALCCPKCGGKVEELDGFYDRHPELREAPEGEEDSS